MSLDLKRRFYSKTLLSLLIIAIIGIAIRVYYYPFNVPIVLDAFTYFTFASDIVALGHLPDQQQFANSGWPIFLSVFFGILQSQNYLDFMNLQRIISTSISVLTIVPVFILCSKFVEKKYAIIGSAVFILEPRVIQNSLLGITEPLYLLLGTTSLALFLNNNRKLVFASFFVAGLAIQVRQEGLFLLLLLTIIFFIRFRNKRAIIDYAVSILIFIMTVLPMAIYRLQASGHDGIISRAPQEASRVLSDNTDVVMYAWSAAENFVKYLGWASIPIFIILVPIGIYYIFKDRDFKKYTIIFGIIIMSLPALYAYSVPAQDTRFLIFLYPMFCVLSAFTVRKFASMVKKPDVILILIVIVIITASISYLEWKIPDSEYELEAFEISKYLINNASGINDFYPESAYLKIASLPHNWPVLSSSLVTTTSIKNTESFTSLSEFLKSAEEDGISHLVIDDKKTRPLFLREVLENKPHYLIEEYDSTKLGYNYIVKIFKIDYELFHSLQ